MKKYIQIIISIIVTISVLSASTALADSKQRPWSQSKTVKIVNHIVYKLDGDHWNVVDFFDSMESSENKDITKIEIPEIINGKPVTEIQNVKYYEANEAEIGKTVLLDENEYVTEIVLPKTIKVICHHAFSGFRSLKKINIPQGVEYIGEHAFDFCSELESLSLPAISGKTLAISSCENLKTLKFTKNPKIIGNITDCYKLKTIKIPKSVIRLGSFEGSGLTKIAIKNNVKISKRAFKNNTKLTKAVFINKKTADKYVIPAEAFSCTPKLTAFRMPKAKKVYINSNAFSSSGIKTLSTKNVIKIGFRAFADCQNLKTITIPNTIEVLGNRVFENCDNLKKVYVKTKNTRIIKKSNSFKYLNKNCTVYVKNNEVKKAIKNAGFKGKVVIKR